MCLFDREHENRWSRMWQYISNHCQVSHNVLQSRHSNKNVFSCRLYHWQIISACVLVLNHGSDDPCYELEPSKLRAHLADMIRQQWSRHSPHSSTATAEGHLQGVWWHVTAAISGSTWHAYHVDAASTRAAGGAATAYRRGERDKR